MKKRMHTFIVYYYGDLAANNAESRIYSFIVNPGGDLAVDNAICSIYSISYAIIPSLLTLMAAWRRTIASSQNKP